MSSQKVFIVTGAYSGIGSATARMLLANGHAVIGIDLKQPAYALTAFHRCDLADPASIDATLDRLRGRYASLLNIAGVPIAYGDEVTLKVNLLGLRRFTEGLWDRLEDGGTVVNVSSLAGNNWRKRRVEIEDLLSKESFEDALAWWHAHKETLKADAYMVSKEAVVVYSMQLAARGLDRRINVNSVAPGPVDTPLLPTFTRDTGAAAMAHYIGLIGRAAKPEDIAEAIVVLAERRIGWLNAVNLNVDGGLTAALSMRWTPRGPAAP